MFNKDKIAWLLVAWAFYLSIGTVSLTVPFVLMVIGTILYLVP